MKLKTNKGKTIAMALTMIGIVVTFCGCGVAFSTYGYDDVYASQSEMASRQVSVIPRQETQPYFDPAYGKSTDIYVDSVVAYDGVEEYAADYSTYDEDDYYDYAYTARIRRFHRPYLMYDYYSDYYTNMYWYNADPFYWGTSIYLGYRWWYPSYSYYWGYTPYYWYGHRYHHHHHCYGYHGYHRHYNISYYNSRDRNSNFYRSNRTSSDINPNRRLGGAGSKTGLAATERNVSSSTFGDRYNTRHSSASTGQKLDIATTKPDFTRTKPSNSATKPSNNLTKQPLTKGNSATLSTTQRQNGQMSKPASTTERRMQKPPQNRNLTTKNPQGVTRQGANNNNRSSAVSGRSNTPNNRTYTPPAVRQPRTTSDFSRKQSTKPSNPTFNSRGTTPQRNVTSPAPSRSSTPSSPSNRGNNSSFRSSSPSSSSSSSSSRGGGSSRSSSSSSSSKSGGRR